MIFFIFITWPISLILHNQNLDVVKYILPAILLLVSFLMYKKNKENYFLPTFLIPFIEPKLAILPFLITLLGKKKSIFIFISLIPLLIFMKPFWGQTIFIKDYEKRQEVIRNTYLYPNVITARIYQNKVKIITDKFNGNLFALIDPNNYFFAFHPREITQDNQNINKFPFITIIFFIIALFNIEKLKNKKFILITLLASVLSLSVLTNYDRNDFILWVPVSLLILSGYRIFIDSIPKKYIFHSNILIVALSFWELVRVLLTR